MNKKFLKIGVTSALILIMMLPTSVLAKQSLEDKNQLVQQPAVKNLATLSLPNMTIKIDLRNLTIIISFGKAVVGNATNIHVDGVSTALLGRPRGNNTVNTTIPFMTPGETVFIKMPAQKGLALMEYNVKAHYQYNGTMWQAQYGPDKYLLFFGIPINIKG